MRYDLLPKLTCLGCRSPRPLTLHAERVEAQLVADGYLDCSICGASYPIIDSIPVLLPAGLQSSDMDVGQRLALRNKRAQMVYFDSVGANELEITRPHGCGRVYNFLLQTKIDAVFSLCGNPLAGHSVLDVCCGSGMDAEFLCRAGATVVGVDISLGALRGAQERARRYGLDYDLIVADAENLPIRDGAFDVTFVHDGLHHLSAPHAGLSEMLRVAEKTALITEPARALATTMGVRLRIAEEVEESGNHVHRFTDGELRQAFAAAGYGRPRFSRYVMYYRQTPLSVFRLFESDVAFAMFRFLYRLVNLLVGRWGNKLAAVAER